MPKVAVLRNLEVVIVSPWTKHYRHPKQKSIHSFGVWSLHFLFPVSFVSKVWLLAPFRSSQSFLLFMT